MEKIHGKITRILFHNKTDSLTIAELKTPYQEKAIIIIGHMLISLDQEISVYGTWTKDFRYGTVFKTLEVKYETDSRVKGIFNYLVSKNIKGIGPKIAQKIIDTFADKTVEVINNEPELLIQVPGLGVKKSDLLIQQLKEQKSLRDTVLFLQEYDIPVHYARKLFATFGPATIPTVRLNPFILSGYIRGIGFKTADLIALKLGLPRDSSYRIKAGIEFSINESIDMGHVCFPLSELILRTKTLLNIDVPDSLPYVEEVNISCEIQNLVTTEILVLKTPDQIPMIWKRDLFVSEYMIAADLKRIMYSPKNIREIPPERSLPWIEEHLHLSLAAKQKEAITLSFTQKLHIITGGPGTGKTTITRAILTIFQQVTHKIILTAPTGKAAKRLSEITQKRAVTVHNLLGYDHESKSFKRNRNNRIDCDLVIVDESGMLDTHLLKNLLQALADTTIIIFIGDVHQLPSVGPGNILKDMINSQMISVTELNEVFRQVHDSGIITNAHRINQGAFPELYKESGKKDFLFFKKDDPKEAVEQILSLILDVIPKKFRIPIKDIQVLSPMKKGILGTNNLNEAIAKAVNPKQPTLTKKWQKFSVNDKVMQIRNNYGKEIFNGDIGYIQSINFHEKSIVVSFDTKNINYSFNELEELTSAYAISVHKYQGSESPCIILPIHTSHYMMLYRNLLYTAVTRGKKLVVLVGNVKAIAIAVSRNKIDSRFTGLERAIRGSLIEGNNVQAETSIQ